MHFEKHAATYQEARPPYPERLWQRIRELGVLRPGLRAVDLGAGTGQATGVLLQAGLEVTAVEPGHELGARLLANHPEARLLEATAETAELAPCSFDVATVATAIHWMDLDVLLPRLHRALVAGGWLLVWRNVWGDAAAAPTPFRERVSQIVARRRQPSRAALGDAEILEAALTRSGLFTTVSVDHVRWSIEMSEQQIRLLFGTFSDWTEPEVEEAALAVRALGGIVTEHYRTWLIALRRADRGTAVDP